MTKERELLSRALEDWDFSDKFETLDPIFEEIRTYLSNSSDDADEPGNGWQLREVYFEDGEPMMYREPTHMNFKGLTLEEMESCIKGNLTITDPNLREGVIASIIDAEHLLMEKNTNGDEPAALKEEE